MITAARRRAATATVLHSTTLRTSAPSTTVSWQVTGIRHDAFANTNRIPVEADKRADERGKFLYPEALGRPAHKGIDYDRIRRPSRATTSTQEPPRPAAGAQSGSGQ